MQTSGGNSMRWLRRIRYAGSGSGVIQATQTTKGAMNWPKPELPDTQTCPAGLVTPPTLIGIGGGSPSLRVHTKERAGPYSAIR